MKWLALLALLQAAGLSSPAIMTTPGTNERPARSGPAVLRPGRWEGRATITDLGMPGAPAQAAAQVRAALARGDVFAKCLTPAQASSPPADLFSGGKDCRYEHFGMANGHVDARAQCRVGDLVVHETTAGQYTRDSLQLTIISKSPGTPNRPMSAYNMTIKLDARRTGKCKGDEPR
ncbi:hypothetical protein FHS95_002609 [Sphingomonas naasensis]|uniref:DUF3617 family protein n=1 Tax=Sphingomonas naasensis TaxID=1344951 RepID=A0A4S1WMW1_9SPHN|nr:DUF3617 family protein [Sphingomonas naasensis]NIJ20917.1 hypothetical protein [Sphingomonas naasensis]TGX43307.1 DUF3617 family protein [Sphingomonas naasensis]